MIRIAEQAFGTDVVAHRSRDHDVVLDVGTGPEASRLRLAATWLPRGWPADVRRLLDRQPDTELLVSPALSAGARRELTARGVSWIDGTGAADVRAPGLIMRLTGDAPADPAAERGVSWSDATVVIAEALLALCPPQITTHWVAVHADCSVPTAGKVLKTFDAEGWTAKLGPRRGPGAHRALKDADGLMAAWSRHVAEVPLVKWFAHSTERDMGRLRRRVSGAVETLEAGWTGWAAGELMAPFTTQVPVLQLRVAERYTRAEVADALATAGVRMTEGAGRIEVWPTDDRVLRLAERHEGEPTCSWARVYADLRCIGGRGADAADHLRDVLRSSA